MMLQKILLADGTNETATGISQVFSKTQKNLLELLLTWLILERSLVQWRSLPKSNCVVASLLLFLWEPDLRIRWRQIRCNRQIFPNAYVSLPGQGLLPKAG